MIKIFILEINFLFTYSLYANTIAKKENKNENLFSNPTGSSNPCHNMFKVLTEKLAIKIIKNTNEHIFSFILIFLSIKYNKTNIVIITPQ